MAEKPGHPVVRFAQQVFGIAKTLRSLEARLTTLDGRVRAQQRASEYREVEALRESLTLARRSEAYRLSFETVDPKVSVCVGTRNRSKLLTERCLPSILAQTHKNLEVIVVGDDCTDDTAERVRALQDSRCTFINLPRHDHYPTESMLRWCVAGTVPFNHALRLASGHFVTHLDDDDEFLPQRLAELIRFARAERMEFLYHPFEFETPDGEWKTNPAESLKMGSVTTSAIFYHRWFAQVPWDLGAAAIPEPGDWNRIQKLLSLEIKHARHPNVLARHFRERANQAPSTVVKS